MDDQRWYTQQSFPQTNTDTFFSQTPTEAAFSPDSLQTPTDATFSPASLQTPRTSTHFSDAFSPYIQEDHSNTPNASHFDNQHLFGQENGNVPFDQAAFSEGMQQLHPQYPSFDMNTQGHTRNKQSTDTIIHSFQTSVQMQTPPPTRDQAARTKSRTQSVMFANPSNMQLQDQGTNLHMTQNQSHQYPPRLQSSMSQPILTQFSGMEQQVAPVNVALDNVFWNSTAPLAPAHMQTHSQPPQPHTQAQWPSLDDPFNFQPQITNHQVPQPASRPSTAHNPPRPVPSNDRPHSAHSHSFSANANMIPNTQPHQIRPMPNMMTSAAGVNPNLLYSSPNRFMSNNIDMHLSTDVQAIVNNTIAPQRQPQIPVAQFDSSRLGSRDQNQVPVLRPGVRRSNTTGAARPQSMYASIDSLTRSNSAAGITRRPSPVKRNNRDPAVSLASIAETPNKQLARSRTSVVLTIDSEGRARAETRVIDDPSPSKADLKCRYPSLWDDSDSDSDSDKSSRKAPSVSSSFAGSKTSERHTKVARLDPPLENLEGLHLPRSNSSASIRATPSKTGYAAAIQLRRQGSAKKPTSSHNRRNTLSVSSRSHTDLSLLDDSRNKEMTCSDASDALRLAREGRSQQVEELPVPSKPNFHTRSQSSVNRPAFPPRTSSLARSQSSFTLDSAPMIPQSAHNSPTKNSPMKPTGDLADAMNSITRCICNFPFTDNQLMIQCNSCHMWLHAGCLGFHPHQLPPHYTCHFCSANQFAFANPNPQTLAHPHAQIQLQPQQYPQQYPQQFQVQTGARMDWRTAAV
ncbi:hypothetical protein MBLNU457_g0164t1 [Dothideomycetes sp. NU457]